MSREMNGSRGPGAGMRDPIAEDREKRILADVDRELATALSVSPSADFEARVLRRVADDLPVRFAVFGEGRGLRTAALLAAAAALVLGAGLFYALTRTAAIDTVSPPQMAHRRPDVVLPSVGPQPPPATNAHEAPRAVAAARAPRPAARRPEPEVIVPLNQMEAVWRLVRAVNEGRVDAPAEAPVGPMTELPELAVTPIVVEPLPLPTADPEAETERPSRDIRRSY